MLANEISAHTPTTTTVVVDLSLRNTPEQKQLCTYRLRSCRSSVFRPSPALPSRASSRHDSSHQLVISRTNINSRFPQVPIIRLIGFPYWRQGLSNTGYILVYIFLFERGPLGRWELIWLAPDLRRQVGWQSAGFTSRLAD